MYIIFEHLKCFRIFFTDAAYNCRRLRKTSPGNIDPLVSCIICHNFCFKSFPLWYYTESFLFFFSLRMSLSYTEGLAESKLSPVSVYGAENISGVGLPSWKVKTKIKQKIFSLLNKFFIWLLIFYLFSVTFKFLCSKYNVNLNMCKY